MTNKKPIFFARHPYKPDDQKYMEHKSIGIFACFSNIIYTRRYEIESRHM